MENREIIGLLTCLFILISSAFIRKKPQQHEKSHIFIDADGYLHEPWHLDDADVDQNHAF